MAKRAEVSAPAAAEAPKKRNAGPDDVYFHPWETGKVPSEPDLSGFFEPDPDEGQSEPEEPVEESPADAGEGEEPDSEGDEALETGSEDEGPVAEDGEEPDSEAEPESAPEDERKYKLKADGEEIEVTLAELKQGYSRTQDYTRKTQLAAEERRQAEQQRAALAEQREQYAAALQLVEQALKPEEPDWEALKTELDPAEYAARWADHQRQAESLKVVEQERKRVLAEHQAEQQKAFAEFQKAEQARLLQVVPEWKDEGERRGLADYLRNMGFSDSDLAGIVDHRAVVIARKAKLYDELRAKGEARVRATPPAPVLKAGSREAAPATRPAKNKEREAALKRLRKTGRAEDAAAAILGMLGD